MTSSKMNDDQCKKPTDFSIDHILNRAGYSNRNDNSGVNFSASTSMMNVECCNSSEIILPWLHCTRYCPPKIPRNQRREGVQKRQMGRHPRIPFTCHQLNVLEEKFQKSPYLSSEEVTKLSNYLQLADIRVKIWFQNRRARERREKQQPLPATETNHKAGTLFTGENCDVLSTLQLTPDTQFFDNLLSIENFTLNNTLN